MKIIEFKAELHGNREVTINGRRLHDGGAMIDEQVIFNKLTTYQQWQILTELNKLQARLAHTYKRSRVKAGEITAEQAVKSGAKGVKGAGLGRL